MKHWCLPSNWRHLSNAWFLQTDNIVNSLKNFHSHVPALHGPIPTYGLVKTHKNIQMTVGLILQILFVTYLWRYCYPRPILAFGYCRCLRLCVCVCPSVCQSQACPCDNSWPVSARITKLDHRCKRPWTRSLLFLGVIDLPHPKWLHTNMFTHSVVSWTVEQSSCIFSVTIAGFPVLDSAIGNGFSMLL